MATLTAKELSLLNDSLSHEQLLIKKFKTFGTNCTDPALKTKCDEVAAKHQEHYNKLLSFLN